jgi:hypothetical protein
MRPHLLVVVLGAMGMLAVGGPCHALPEFARQYGLECQKCHSVPPRLNSFGLAFQANYFNLPPAKPPAGNPPVSTKGSGTIQSAAPAATPRSGNPPVSKGGAGFPPIFGSFPISGIATFSLEANRTEGKTTANFRELELFFVRGFLAGTGRPGGGIVEAVAATTEQDERAGKLGKAMVALPVTGRRGQGSLIVGQLIPVMFQYDPSNQLAETDPFALADDLDGFSFTGEVPGVAGSYFDHRGEGTADGNYVTLGVPFKGQLALNRDLRLGDPRGVFVHAFRRRGWTSLGVVGYTRAGNHLEGVIGTYELRKNLYLLGVGALGHDSEGSTRRLSLQGEYVTSPRLALTARLESLGGRQNDLGEVAAVTYYPFKFPVLRLTAELTQRKGDRSFILFARGQF